MEKKKKMFHRSSVSKRQKTPEFWSDNKVIPHVHTPILPQFLQRIPQISSTTRLPQSKTPPMTQTRENLVPPAHKLGKHKQEK